MGTSGENKYAIYIHIPEIRSVPVNEIMELAITARAPIITGSQEGFLTACAIKLL
jgi:hypothetical protein